MKLLHLALLDFLGELLLQFGARTDWASWGLRHRRPFGSLTGQMANVRRRRGTGPYVAPTGM